VADPFDVDKRHWIVIGVVLAFTLPFLGLAVVDLHSDPNEATLFVDGSGPAIAANETVPFDSLSTAQQQVFERALRSEDGIAPIPRDVNRTAWIEHRGVRYENETYEAVVAVP